MVTMTGKDLIVYILKNDLENEVLVRDGVFVGLMNEEEAAVKFEVGVATIRLWYELKMLGGISIGDSIFFLRNVSDPRKEKV